MLGHGHVETDGGRSIGEEDMIEEEEQTRRKRGERVEVGNERRTGDCVEDIVLG